MPWHLHLESGWGSQGPTCTVRLTSKVTVTQSPRVESTTFSKIDHCSWPGTVILVMMVSCSLGQFLMPLLATVLSSSREGWSDIILGKL